jgi:uncharacterized protein (DUF1015 family)
MDPHTVVTPPYVAGPFRLLPFPALRLEPSRVGDPSTGRAFARPYKSVAARLRRWQERGRLARDDRPALYLHEYSAAGMTIRGLVGALDVSQRATSPAERAVLPHEGIHPAQADDLADRMAEMQLNPAPILLVHRGTQEGRDLLGEIAATDPTHEFTDRSEQHHRIWTITDTTVLDRIATDLAGTRALIADGHHRYAAYLRLQRRHPGTAYDYGLAMLVDQTTTPLFLGPIHRSLTGTTLDDLRNAAETLGMTYAERTRADALAALDAHHLTATDGETWATVEMALTADRATVEVFHDEIVPALPHGPSAVGHHHAVETALRQAQPQLAITVLLPAPSVDLVQRIAADDRLLPEKSTSFQPKPSLGVLIRHLDAPIGQS